MATKVLPTCISTHIFDSGSCECIVKKAVKRNKKITLKSKIKKRSPSAVKTQKKLPINRKRCPNGTRKNKITGECDGPKTKSVLKTKAVPKTKAVLKTKSDPKTKKEKLITIKDLTPLEDRNISRAISTVISKASSSSSSFKDIAHDVRKELISNKSFSPSVNKRLVSLHNTGYSGIFGCGLEDVLLGKVKASAKTLRVRTKTSASGSPICSNYNTKAAKTLMLNNLAASKKLHCHKVVAPLQLQSNCWFNTMYMVFFISDKGRKFFRFFRQLMIEGQQENGEKISPPRLAQALFLFNAYIESSYNLDDSSKTIMAEGMDTNILIAAIYKSIPKKYKDVRSGLRSPGEYGNPLHFYQSIILYLSNNSIRFFEPEPLEIRNMLAPRHNYTGRYYMPDVIVVKIYDDYPMFKSMVIADNVTTRQQSFTRIYTGDDPLTEGQSKEAKYVLDSAIVRSTNGEHFCAMITCNGQQMGFDGGSLVRLSPMPWKDWLNKDISWTFEYDSSNKLRWDFKKSYQQLYYYRM